MSLIVRLLIVLGAMGVIADQVCASPAPLSAIGDANVGVCLRGRFLFICTRKLRGGSGTVVWMNPCDWEGRFCCDTVIRLEYIVDTFCFTMGMHHFVYWRFVRVFVNSAHEHVFVRD